MERLGGGEHCEERRKWRLWRRGAEGGDWETLGKRELGVDCDGWGKWRFVKERGRCEIVKIWRI